MQLFTLCPAKIVMVYCKKSENNPHFFYDYNMSVEAEQSLVS